MSNEERIARLYAKVLDVPSLWAKVEEAERGEITWRELLDALYLVLAAVKSEAANTLVRHGY